MIIIYIFLAMLIIISSIAIGYIINFNNLQECKTKIDESESIIDECLRKKYDIISRIKELILNNIDTKVSFKELDNIKQEDISNFDFDRKLNDICQLLNKIQDDYPNLVEIKEYRTLNNDIKRVNEKIAAAKSYYNKYTSISNDLTRKFPSNIIAKLHGIKVRNFFDNKDMNDDNINDFKL